MQILLVLRKPRTEGLWSSERTVHLHFSGVFFSPQQGFQKLIYEIYEMGWAVWLETSFVGS